VKPGTIWLIGPRAMQAVGPSKLGSVWTAYTGPHGPWVHMLCAQMGPAPYEHMGYGYVTNSMISKGYVR
jgi:hypothetical protein